MDLRHLARIVLKTSQELASTTATMAQNMCKTFSLVPSKKTCHQRKLRQSKCLLFNFGVIKFTVIPKQD